MIETIRVRAGRLPLLERHLHRLERSLRELGLPRPARDVAALVAPYAQIDDGVVRLEVTDGRAALTVRDLLSTAPTLITASTPHKPYPHKTGARQCFDAALAEARSAAADDALLLAPAGWVAEGSVWTVFWWDADRLCTPALELGILPGVARARVCELMPVIEGRYPRAALDGHSVFLTNAVRGIVPIPSLDGVPVPVDVRTAALAGSFWPAAA